jgi:hypothetical protein
MPHRVRSLLNIAPHGTIAYADRDQSRAHGGGDPQRPYPHAVPLRRDHDEGGADADARGRDRGRRRPGDRSCRRFSCVSLVRQAAREEPRGQLRRSVAHGRGGKPTVSRGRQGRLRHAVRALARDPRRDRADRARRRLQPPRRRVRLVDARAGGDRCGGTSQRAHLLRPGAGRPPRHRARRDLGGAARPPCVRVPARAAARAGGHPAHRRPPRSDHRRRSERPGRRRPARDPRGTIWIATASAISRSRWQAPSSRTSRGSRG